MGEADHDPSRLVSQKGIQVPPVQGFVIDWKRHSYRWSALTVVTLFDDNGDPVLVQRWIPAHRLTPVLSNPNDGRPLRIQ